MRPKPAIFLISSNISSRGWFVSFDYFVLQQLLHIGKVWFTKSDLTFALQHHRVTVYTNGIRPILNDPRAIGALVSVLEVAAAELNVTVHARGHQHVYLQITVVAPSNGFGR